VVDPVDAVVVVTGTVVLLTAFALFIAAFCSVNERVESEEMRIGSRVAERALTFGDPTLERDRRRHYDTCDAHARGPAMVEILPSASRRGAA
jgi:hypothetical protein